MSQHQVKAAAFDLDGTLAPSKAALDPAMAAALGRLLDRMDVCIISGGRFEQIRTQVLGRLDVPESGLARLHVMPTCGTSYYQRRQGRWALVYAEDLTRDESGRAAVALEAAARALGLWDEQPWGEIIEDRGSQVTFSALGQAAPAADKLAWDPDGAKKRALRDLVAARLPDLEVRGGGSTSIDVTRLGIDKAYGIRRLLDLLDLQPADLVFVGDRLDEAGNDHPVLATGVTCRAVADWHETLRVVDDLVAAHPTRQSQPQRAEFDA